MAEAWRFADILRHFPVFEFNGQLWVDVEGQQFTRDDVLARWAAYCDEARNGCPDEQEEADDRKSPTKHEVVRVIVKAQSGT